MISPYVERSIKRSALRLSHRLMPAEDLEQVGRIAAWEAREDTDARQTMFANYAMLHYRRDYGSLIKAGGAGRRNTIPCYPVGLADRFERRRSLDDTERAALGNVEAQRLLERLGEKDRKYLLLRMDGWSDSEIPGRSAYANAQARYSIRRRLIRCGVTISENIC